MLFEQGVVDRPGDRMSTRIVGRRRIKRPWRVDEGAVEHLLIVPHGRIGIIRTAGQPGHRKNETENADES